MLKDLPEAKRLQLGRVLMNDILIVLRPEDFGGLPNENQATLPHLGIPASRFLEMFYDKCGKENKEVLDNYADCILEKGRMITLQEGQEWSALKRLREMERKNNGKTK